VSIVINLPSFSNYSDFIVEVVATYTSGNILPVIYNPSDLSAIKNARWLKISEKLVNTTVNIFPKFGCHLSKNKKDITLLPFWKFKSWPQNEV